MQTWFPHNREVISDLKHYVVVLNGDSELKYDWLQVIQTENI